MLTNTFINFLISGATGNTHVILKVVLWIFGFSFTAACGIGLGMMVGGIIHILFETAEDNKRLKNRKSKWQERVEEMQKKTT